MTPTVLELGGKSPCIVDATADLDLFGKRCSWGSFTNAGQTCVRPDFLFVHESVADKAIASLKKHTLSFYGKDPQRAPEFGRVINERAHKRLAKKMPHIA